MLNQLSPQKMQNINDVSQGYMAKYHQNIVNQMKLGQEEEKMNQNANYDYKQDYDFEKEGLWGINIFNEYEETQRGLEVPKSSIRQNRKQRHQTIVETTNKGKRKVQFEMNNEEDILENFLDKKHSPQSNAYHKISHLDIAEKIVKLELQDMGFKRPQIEALFELEMIESAQQAVDLLIKGETGYLHKYNVNKQGINCKVCGEDMQEHVHSRGEALEEVIRMERELRDRLLIRQSLLNFDLAQQVDHRSSLIQFKPAAVPIQRAVPVDVGGILCEICYMNYNESDLYGIKCNHRYCKNCLYDYLEYNISNGQVRVIKCADAQCKEEFTKEDVEKFGSKEIYDKYLKFKENIDVNLNPNLKWCPKPNCNNYISKGKKRKVTCKCGLEICFDCGIEWHGKIKCKEVMDKEFFSWAANNGNISNCPKCKVRLEKISGCNHMTCRQCGYSWCWLCGKKYTDFHYNPINVFGCPDAGVVSSEIAVNFPKIPIVKSSIDYVSIYSNQQDMKTIFRRVKRQEDHFKKTLSQSHNKFYQKIMHHKRLQLQEELGTGFQDLIDDGQVITKKQHKDQLNKFKRFASYVEDDLDTGLSKHKKEEMIKKHSIPEKYEQLMNENPSQAKQDFLNENLTQNSPDKNQSPAQLIKDPAYHKNETKVNLDNEFEQMFAQQRQVNFLRQKRLSDQLIDREEMKQLFDPNALENLSFVQYVKYMKDKELIEQVTLRLFELKPELKQGDINDIKRLLSEADKKLFVAYRDDQITLDQLKTRVNQKMRRATYKCLDDLVQDGLHLTIIQDLDQAEKLIKMIHGTDSIKDVSISDLTQLNKPWQSNPHCLRSLFQETQNGKRKQYQQQMRSKVFQGLSNQDIINNEQIINGQVNYSMLDQQVQNDPKYNHKKTFDEKSEKKQTGIKRTLSEENFQKYSKKRGKRTIFGDTKSKERQQVNKENYIRKLKKTLNDYQSKYQKQQILNAGDRNDQDENEKYSQLGADMQVFVIPFDLKKIDETMKDKFQFQADQDLIQNNQNTKFPGQQHQTFQRKATLQDYDLKIENKQSTLVGRSVNQSIDNANNQSTIGTSSFSRRHKKKPVSKDLLFLRQINQNGGNVILGQKQQFILQEFHEDQDNDAYDGKSRRIEIRKPRPRDIMKRRDSTVKGMLNNQSMLSLNTADQIATPISPMKSEYGENFKQIVSNQFDQQEALMYNDTNMELSPKASLTIQNMTRDPVNETYVTEERDKINEDLIKLPLKIESSNKLFIGVLQSRKHSNINTSLYNSPEQLNKILKSPQNTYQNYSSNMQKQNNQPVLMNINQQSNLSINQQYIRNVQSQQHSRRQSLQGKSFINSNQMISGGNQSTKSQKSNGQNNSQQRYRNSAINTKTQQSTNVSQNFLNYVENLGIPINESFLNVNSSQILKRNRIFSAKQRPSKDHESSMLHRTPSQSSHFSVGFSSNHKLDYKSGAIAYRIAMKHMENQQNFSIKTSAENILSNINTLSHQIFTPVMSQGT
eukprot:403333348